MKITICKNIFLFKKIGKIFVVFLLQLALFQSTANADWLEETSSYGGGWLINAGLLNLKGSDNHIFDSSSSTMAGVSYINPFNKKAFTRQIMYFEYGISLTKAIGEFQTNKTCIINHFKQDCKIYNEMIIITVTASSLLFWHFSDLISAYGRLGIGYYKNSIEQKAVSLSGESNVSDENSASFTPQYGAGILISKTIKLEYTIHGSFGADVPSASSKNDIIPGSYSGSEIKLSLAF